MVNGTMLSSLILFNGRSINGTFIIYHSLSALVEMMRSMRARAPVQVSPLWKRAPFWGPNSENCL
jgi:hypothetical protein